MPKKIPDLEENILKAAGRLFLTKGFTETSMGQVAAEAGTSVGNLYNYFPAKKDLFLAGRRQWLQGFAIQIAELAESGGDPFDVLENTLLRMMGFLGTWGGFWEEFLAVTSREVSKEELAVLKAEMRDELRLYVVEKVDSLLRRLTEGNPQLRQLLALPEHRLAASLVAMLKTLSVFYPGEGELNCDFVRLSLRTLCRKPLNPDSGKEL
jgi:AcrR family transcriptional regulator